MRLFLRLWNQRLEAGSVVLGMKISKEREEVSNSAVAHT